MKRKLSAISQCYRMGKEGANSGTATGGHFDAFLSFRGPDTRNTFTDFLYEFMNSKGIRVFRDEEELDPGKNISEILRAVECSQIYIPILSRGYTSSRWCLRELTCIVECTYRSTGKEILPVFYDVEPSDVKLETELYESALREHEDSGCTEVKHWKEALTTVARIKGWCLKGQRHGKVAADITEKVLQKIAIRKRYLPPGLVGIDDHVEAIKKLLSCDTGGVRFVVIHGIGGIGKTTLAETVFNQLSHQFEGHSFLSNFRESCSYRGIVKMQRKLVADLFNFSLRKTTDRKEGNNMIKERLPNKRVLLVLDDLDEKHQFMNLVMNSYSYGPGSRIIITTRDFPMTSADGLEENILTRSGQIFRYQMKEMHFEHALLLFSKHAFNTDSAPSELNDLSRRVVELTGGLPLALELIGSELRTISGAKWENVLMRLTKIPHPKVQERLRISYDALVREGQQIYLDIACFFVNKKKTNAMYMWEACSFYPEVEIDVLIHKSLIKIDHDRIWMHNQLRDLGRDIIRQESIGTGDQSRFWFLEMSQAKEGTKNGVALTPISGDNFTRKDFAKLKNARFLKLDGGNIASDCEDILPELRWLSWQNCPSQLQANNFVLNHLVVLKLSGKITTEEWSSWLEIMVASKLKVLKISGSKSLIGTPHFSEFVNLERLVLKDCLMLTEIDPSIGELQRLIYLKIKWCPRLKGLPKEIGCLTALKELILIQGHRVRYLPDSLGNIRGLVRLVVEDTGLVELPDTIKGLVDLKHLSLVNCTDLNSLSDALGELKSLAELDLSGTTIGSLPRLIWNRECPALRINSFGIRRQLMRDMPMHGHGGASQHGHAVCPLPVHGHGVSHLEDSIGNLRGLPRLSIGDTGSVELQPTINRLGDLRSLHLSNSTSLNSLSDAARELRTSTELHISGNSKESDISWITPRRTASIWNVEDLTLWMDGHRTPSTRDLPIEGDSVCYLPDSIGNLRGLPRLSIGDTGSVELPATINRLWDLKSLHLSNCMRLNLLSDAVRELRTLIELDHAGIIPGRRSPSIWNIKDLTLRMDSRWTRRLLTRDLPILGSSVCYLSELIGNPRGSWSLASEDTRLDVRGRRKGLEDLKRLDVRCRRKGLEDTRLDVRGRRKGLEDLKSLYSLNFSSLRAEPKTGSAGLLGRLYLRKGLRTRLRMRWDDLICKQDCKRDHEQHLISRWLGVGSTIIRFLRLMAFEVDGLLLERCKLWFCT